MVRDLAPLIGRRLSLGVVPRWHGEWRLSAHPDFCTLLRESAEELLLHGFTHRRQRGWGPVSLLTGGCDEMKGLNADETRQTVEQGQREFTRALGRPARTFLAPGWQRGDVRLTNGDAGGVEHLLGFFSLDSVSGRRVPLATWTWDCGSWDALGHVGHGAGRLLQSLGRRVPSLAIHPRDMERGFWPRILRLTERLLEAGYKPTTPTVLLEAGAETVAPARLAASR